MNLTPSFVLLIGSIYGFLSVALGAFGAHALKGKLDDYSMGVFHTGVQYQSIHALALVALGALFVARPALLDARGAQTVVLCFAAGVVIFSGSLYALAFSGVKVLGAITPIGGALFLAGWIALAVFSLAVRSVP